MFHVGHLDDDSLVGVHWLVLLPNSWLLHRQPLLDGIDLAVLRHGLL
jgi:hypothetical protein